MRCWLILLALGLVGKAPASEPAERAVSARPPTIPIHILARDIESYRGQSVRTCGTRLEPALREKDGQIAYWILSGRDPSTQYGFHAGVILPHCGARPRLANGCATGRVARDDGSLEIPREIIVSDHIVIRHEWWLHIDCNRQAGRH